MNCRFELYAKSRGGVYISSSVETYRMYHFKCSEGHNFSSRGSIVYQKRWCPTCGAVNRKINTIKKNKERTSIPQSFNELKNTLFDMHKITLITDKGGYTKLDIVEVIDINGKLIKKKIADLYRYGAGQKDKNKSVFYETLQKELSDKCLEKGWVFLKLEPLHRRGLVFYKDNKGIERTKQVIFFKKNKHKLNKRLSKQQGDLEAYVTSLGFSIQSNKRLMLSQEETDYFEWYFKHIPSGRKRSRYCELDLYIPDKNLAIEFHGAAFHDAFGVDGDKHRRLPRFKYELCKIRNIRLLQIYEYEWANKKEQIKHLIKSSLGIKKTRVFARKCEIREVASDVAQDFYNSYHIKGKSPTSTYHEGLFYNGELLMTISIGKEGRGPSKEMSVTRMCVKPDFLVVGGLSKLTNSLTKKFSKISTLIDLMHFSGYSWVLSGWKVHKKNPPNYVYYNKKTKTKVDKQKFSKIKNEYSYVKALGDYCQLWDCGKLRLIIDTTA